MSRTPRFVKISTRVGQAEALAKRRCFGRVLQPRLEEPRNVFRTDFCVPRVARAAELPWEVCRRCIATEWCFCRVRPWKPTIPQWNRQPPCLREDEMRKRTMSVGCLPTKPRCCKRWRITPSAIIKHEPTTYSTDLLTSPSSSSIVGDECVLSAPCVSPKSYRTSFVVRFDSVNQVDRGSLLFGSCPREEGGLGLVIRHLSGRHCAHSIAVVKTSAEAAECLT